MSKVAIVTGANQGLGLALVRGLLAALPPDAAVYLTARDEARGRAAAAALEAEGRAPRVRRLDVTEADSVAGLAAVLRAEHGGVDIVISNAAARMDKERPAGEQVRAFVDTNNLGTHRMLEHFAPLLRDGGRFLVVASAFGRLTQLGPAVRGAFDPRSVDLAGLERALADWVALVEAGRAEAAGWPAWINVPSKVAQVAALRIAAARLREEAERRDLLLAAVCPGLVDTDASRPWFADMSSAQTPDAAARDVVWLATAATRADGVYGELVQHRRVLPFE